MNALDNPQDPNAPLNKLAVHLRGLPLIAGFVYSFDNGANIVTCETTISLTCATGKTLEYSLLVFVEAYLLVLQVIVNVIRVIVNIITLFSIGDVPDLNLDPFVTAGYGAGCKGGVLVSTLIPITAPCFSGQDNYCAVREYKVLPSPQNPMVCAATGTCRIGNWLGAYLEVVALWLQFGNRILSSFSASSRQSADGALLFILQKLLYIFVYKVLSPICPVPNSRTVG